MNVIAEIQRINAAELENGLVNTSASWHTKYANSAWVYVGNLPLQLTEGDVICFMSQWGEIEDINLVRDEDTGKSRGFAFVKYEDARSCVLAVDNFAGTKLLGRSIRVDHVEKYRLPKHLLEAEESKVKDDGEADVDAEDPRSGGDLPSTGNRCEAGHAYKGKELASSYDINRGQDLFAPQPSPPVVAAEQSMHVKSERSNDKDDSGDGNGERTMSKEEKREAKQLRKEARAQKRKEKEERRKRNEERREKKRHKRERRTRSKKDEAEKSVEERYVSDDSRQRRTSKRRLRSRSDSFSSTSSHSYAPSDSKSSVR